jgi:dolichol-phosphate hexosyltransferase
MVELSILMPVYDEVGTVEDAVRRVLAAGITVPFEILLIDDGSTDGTSLILDRLAAEIPDVRLERHTRNLGKGAAIRTGLQRASGRVACIHDADLEYDPRDLVPMLEAMAEGRWDAVYGVRSFAAHASHSLLYVLGNKAVTASANVLFNRYIRDMMTCYKMLPLELFRALELRSSGFEIEAEITGKLLRDRRHIFEVPISYRARGHDEGKKLRGRDALRVLAMLLRLRFGGGREAEGSPAPDEGVARDRAPSMKLLEHPAAKRIKPWLSTGRWAETRTTRAAAVVVILAAFVHAMATTPLWSMIGETFRPHESYGQLRGHMFDNFPVDVVNAKLDAIIPRTAGVDLGPGIMEHWFLIDHVPPGLHPRDPDSSSRYKLDVVADPRPEAGAIDLAQAPTGVVRLYGADVQTAPFAVPRSDLYAFSWPGLLLGVLMLLGWGFVVRQVLFRLGLPKPTADPTMAALSVPLGGFLFLALVATAGTWVQVPVPWRFLFWAGVVFGALHVARLLLRLDLQRAWSTIRPKLIAPDTALVAIFLLFLFVRVANFPFSSWDPHTMWLLAAQRLADDGMITRHDVFLPLILGRHHPGYPLLYPAAMTALGALTGTNERMLAMAAPVLFSCLTILVWVLSRRVLGRWTGLGFTFVLLLTVVQIAAWGMADPFVLMLLCAAVLAFAGGAPRTVGWFCLGLAALTKQEGLILGAVVGVGALALAGRPGWSRRSELRNAAWLLPGFAHYFFGQVILHIPEDFTGIRWGSILTEASGRVRILTELTPWILHRYALLRVGLAALPLLVAGVLVWKRRGRQAMLAAGSAVVLNLIFIGLMFITPKDVRWHAGSALDRLLLHPAAFSLLGLLILLRAAPDVPPEPAVEHGTEPPGAVEVRPQGAEPTPVRSPDTRVH